MSSEVRVVLCTVPDPDTAGHIAEALVAEKLAACVNILPGITSVYRWQEAVENAAEVLLLIKTDSGAWPRLEARIRSLHPYELPEIIAVPIEQGQPDYLNWIHESLK